MEVSFKKDGKENFMIIKHKEIDEDDYKLIMIENNKIEGLIPLKVMSVNNNKEIYYNISSKTSIKNMYGRKKLSGIEIYNLIRDIQNLIENLNEYLLDVDNILFSAEYVYVRNKVNKYEFCYVPDVEGTFQEHIRELFEQVLESINHSDKEAVLIAYGIQQITISSDFTISDLMQCAKENLNQKLVKENQTKEEISVDELSNDNNFKNVEINSEDTITEHTKSSLFQRIKDKFKKKSSYITEDELQDFSIIGEDNINEYTGELEESATMLLTSSGSFDYITLHGTDPDNIIEITPTIFPCIIGKSKKSSNYNIDNSVISRVHIRISEDTNGYMVEDLNSTNGSYLNGERLNPHEPHELNIGDSLVLANIEFVIE